MPNKCIVTLPEMYTVTCGCEKKSLEDVTAASLVLHAQNIASATEKDVVPKFTHTVGHCIRYANINIKDFSEPNFPVYG